MNITIVDYGAGNVTSVVRALQRLGVEATLTDDPELIAKADKVVFPGQGEASNAMQNLRQRGLDKVLRDLKQPFLGICIGQQLMCRHSEEGDTDTLGIFDVPVLRFVPQCHEDKVPHMGWNTLSDLRSPLFKGIEEGAYTYFVHSFYVPLCDETIATTNYILPFSAALRHENFFATQFHPEKSGDVGERILQNFLELNIEH
jgi:glutamine amidotransferase